jgi:hypothetical protein
MTPDAEPISRLLHDLTPEPPVPLQLENIALRVRNRRSRQAASALTFAVLTIAVAMVLPRSLGQHTNPATSHDTASTNGTAPSGSTAPAPVCQTNAMRLGLAWQTVDGRLVSALTVTNQTGEICTLRSRPLLDPLNQNGQPLDTQQVQPVPAAPAPVALRPGASAASSVYWSDWCSGPQPGSTLRVGWLGGGSSIVSSSNQYPPRSCAKGTPPAGTVSSGWFLSLLTPPGTARTVTENETFLNGQETIQPPVRPATDFPTTPRQALALATSPLANGGTVTVEYGLYSNNTAGTYDPKPLNKTRLFFQRVPAYIVVTRSPTLAFPTSQSGPGVAVTAVDAATGKPLGTSGEGTSQTSATPTPADNCGWTLTVNGTNVTSIHGQTSITVHRGDRLGVTVTAGCKTPTLLSATGTARFSRNSDGTITPTTAGNAEISADLAACGIHTTDPCFANPATLGPIRVTVEL